MYCHVIVVMSVSSCILARNVSKYNKHVCWNSTCPILHICVLFNFYGSHTVHATEPVAPLGE